MGLKTTAIATGGALGLLLTLAAATAPQALSEVQPGLWEFSGKGEPARVCVADLSALSQFQHREARCTRELLRDLPRSAEVQYKCSGSSFGRTSLTVITPRSLKIQTQGIDGGAPFNHTLQARRIGDCPSR